MSATTVNAFPPLHAFNSSRAWFLALIVLLHAGFFWVLTHGVTIGSLSVQPQFILIDPAPAKPLPPPKPRPLDIDPVVNRVYVPQIEIPRLEPIEDTKGPLDTTEEPLPVPPDVIRDAPGRGPVIVEPMVDPRFGLTEPEYPVSEIRLGHAGTVWLSVEVLPNGRVGQVRIDQSSGYAKLDDSAARQARKWRMKPGMQDGVALAMWKRVPITFRLKD